MLSIGCSTDLAQPTTRCSSHLRSMDAQTKRRAEGSVRIRCEFAHARTNLTTALFDQTMHSSSQTGQEQFSPGGVVSRLILWRVVICSIFLQRIFFSCQMFSRLMCCDQIPRFLVLPRYLGTLTQSEMDPLLRIQPPDARQDLDVESDRALPQQIRLQLNSFHHHPATISTSRHHPPVSSRKFRDISAKPALSSPDTDLLID